MLPKVIKRSFKNLNQEVLQCLQKFEKTKIKDFMHTFLAIFNKEVDFLDFEVVCLVFPRLHLSKARALTDGGV